jgi:hypothetical protein
MSVATRTDVDKSSSVYEMFRDVGTDSVCIMVTEKMEVSWT